MDEAIETDLLLAEEDLEEWRDANKTVLIVPDDLKPFPCSVSSDAYKGVAKYWWSSC